MPETKAVETPAPAAPAMAIKPPKKQDRLTVVLLVIAALVAVGGISFAVGHATGSGETAAANQGGAGAGGPGGAMPSLAPGQTFSGGGQLGGGISGGISGTVTAITAATMTIQESNGTTVTIDLASGTTYHSQAAAGSSDVKTGSTVTVQVDNSATTSGSPNPSASGTRTLTAKDILVTQP
jgi:hypothetical protein